MANPVGCREPQTGHLTAVVTGLRELGLPDDAPHVNANGGAIALGMTGARLALTLEATC